MFESTDFIPEDASFHRAFARQYDFKFREESTIMAKKVVCYASGVIGTSWATNFALKGCFVTVYDLQQPFLEQAERQIRENLIDLAENDCLAEAEIPQILSRISYTTDVQTAVRDAEFIQESAPEKLALKQTIIQLLDQYAPEDCVIASSTSGLRISDITAKSTHPERYIGAHPFNPPHLIPLVEITKGESTSPATIERAVEFYRSMDKEPVVLQKEKVGFIANRFQHAVLREVIALVTEGVCTVADADRALTYGPGLRWAAIGQGLIGELASPDGARAFNERFRPASERIFRDLSDLTEIPDTWLDLVDAGVTAEKAELSDHIGHTREEIAAFRDKVLLSLLKIHGKL